MFSVKYNCCQWVCGNRKIKIGFSYYVVRGRSAGTSYIDVCAGGLSTDR